MLQLNLVSGKVDLYDNLCNRQVYEYHPQGELASSMYCRRESSFSLRDSRNPGMHSFPVLTNIRHARQLRKHYNEKGMPGHGPDRGWYNTRLRYFPFLTTEQIYLST